MALVLPGNDCWIVAAPGPSLSIEVAAACDGWNVLAVNDAYQLFPNAKCVYAADADWWKARKGIPTFTGDKWTVRIPSYNNLHEVKRYHLKTIYGRKGDGFCFTPNIVHLGGNSGFQAVNLVLHFGATRIIMVGFDMNGSHFFGKHEPPLRQKSNFALWIDRFKIAADMLPSGIKIINATPDSALTAFPIMTIEEAFNASR